jgi:hypothetical protein
MKRASPALYQEVPGSFPTHTLAILRYSVLFLSLSIQMLRKYLKSGQGKLHSISFPIHYSLINPPTEAT